MMNLTENLGKFRSEDQCSLLDWLMLHVDKQARFLPNLHGRLFNDDKLPLMLCLHPAKMWTTPEMLCAELYAYS